MPGIIILDINSSDSHKNKLPVSMPAAKTCVSYVHHEVIIHES